MGGWIKIHRDILTWGWWDDDATAKAFITILLLCATEETYWHGEKLRAGEFVTSRKHLSMVLGKSEQNVRTILSRLVKTGEIKVRSTNKRTIITVCNWESYQSNQQNAQKINQQEVIEDKQDSIDFLSKSTNNQPTINQQSTNKPNHNQEIRKENSSPQNTNVFLPPNGEPAKAKKKVFVKPTVEEVAAYCRERGNSINPQAFVSHYEANGWVCGKAKAPMRDWKAAVRLWETYDKKQSTKSPANHASFDYAPDESGTDESKWFQ